MEVAMTTPVSRLRLSRRALLRATAAGAALAVGGLDATSALAAPPASPALAPGNPALADDVRQEFLTAWTAYRRLAWGRDELRPVSGTGAEFFIPGAPLGL